jgi:hypothetical protein
MKFRYNFKKLPLLRQINHSHILVLLICYGRIQNILNLGLDLPIFLLLSRLLTSILFALPNCIVFKSC